MGAVGSERNTTNKEVIMKMRLYAIVTAAALSLAAADTGHAMSELVSLSTAPMWPMSPTPEHYLLYYVTTVGRGGAGLLEVELTAGNLPPGVTVTFEPSVLRFTGNKLTAQTAIMAVDCPSLMPLDCHPFSLTGTALRETLSVTNQIVLTVQDIAARKPYLYLDKWGNGELRLRGLGVTGEQYQIEAKDDLIDGTWEPVGNSTADGNGRFTFFTAPEPGAPVRYYRAVLPAPDADPQP
jgi:hypothetical protein